MKHIALILLITNYLSAMIPSQSSLVESAKIAGAVTTAAVGYSLTHIALDAHLNPLVFKKGDDIDTNFFEPVIAPLARFPTLYARLRAIESPTLMGFIPSLKTAVFYGLLFGTSAALLAQVPLHTTSKLPATDLLKPGMLAVGVTTAAAGIGGWYGYRWRGEEQANQYQWKLVHTENLPLEEQILSPERREKIKQRFSSATANDAGFYAAVVSGFSFLAYIVGLRSK